MLLAVAIPLAGAGAAAVLTLPDASQAQPPAIALPQPLASLQLSSAQQRSLDHAEDVLVRRCMRTRGLDFPVQPTAAAQGFTDPNPYGLLDPAEAAKQGYGLHGPTKGNTPDRTWTARETRALLGTPAHEKKLPLPGGGYTVENTDGCFSQAQDKLYGQAWKRLHYGEETLFARELARVRQDPGVREAKTSWASCMRASGYRVAALQNVMDDAVQSMASTGSDRASGQAQFTKLWKQAQRDAACQRKAKVVSAFRRAQDAVEPVVTRGESSDLARLADLRNHALSLSGQLQGVG